jgi:sugar/nucleoside kinase (ribokinase family)
VVVFSEADEFEADAMHAARSRPRVVVQTNGSRGGSWSSTSGAHGIYAPVPPPGPIRDTYGAGDTFAAALTCSLASSLGLEDALAEAAAQAAACLTWWGPYPSSAQPRPGRDQG